MSGFSAGALAAVLSLCGVEPQAAHDVAFELANDAGVFTNPLGLAFKWGRLVEAWLQRLLPEDAAERCNGAAGIVMTIFTPRPRVARATSFATRDELISCLMASTHIPWFMNGCFTRPVVSSSLGDAYGTATVHAADGGCLEFVGRETPLSLMTHGSPADSVSVLLDPLADAQFMAACSANGWSMLKPYGCDEFIRYGRAYVEAHAAAGGGGVFAPLARRLKLDARRGADALPRRRPQPRGTRPGAAVSVESPPLVHRRSSLMRAGRSGMRYYVLKAFMPLVLLVLLLALAPFVVARWSSAMSFS